MRLAPKRSSCCLPIKALEDPRAVTADFTVTKVTPGGHCPQYCCGHDAFTAKLPGGGSSGRHDRLRDADRSLDHVMVVRIGSAALEHDPEKWEPVFREDHAPTTS
jgi:hypothetical protein